MDNNVWQRNSGALARHRPDLLNLVREKGLAPVGEYVETAAGPVTLKFQAESGQELFAYNPDDPLGDSMVHLETVGPESRGLAVFLGLGLGYGPLLVHERRPDLGRLVIIEPSLDLFGAALHAVDLTPLIVDPKVSFLVGDLDLASLERLAGRIVAIEDTHILRHIASFQWNPSLYTGLNDRVFMLLNKLNAQGGTISKIGPRFFRNRFANLTLLRHSHGLEPLEGLFAGRPAVLVAAGPSLDRSIEGLREIAGRCVMISVDSALAPLLRAGISPDFVTSIDFLDLNFEKLAPYLAETMPCSLVATPKVSPLVPKRFPARHLFWAFHSDPPQQWIIDHLGIRTVAPVTLSVAHLSFGLAWLMGADPIFLVGQDLAYTTAALDHAAGTVISMAGLPKDKEIFQVTGLDGKKVPTDRTLMSIQQNFEELIAEYPGACFNCSAAGARIKGAEPLPLAEAGRRFMDGPVPVLDRVDRAVAGDKPFPVTAFRRACVENLERAEKTGRDLDEVKGLGERLTGQLADLRAGGANPGAMDDLPASLRRQLVEFDRINRSLDSQTGFWDQMLELTFQSLGDNDSRRDRNARLREKQGYLSWLGAEIERIARVNDDRARAVAKYRGLLGELVDHLGLEESLLAGDRAAMPLEARVDLARAYLRAGDFLLAHAVLEQVLVQAPGDAEALVLAGDAAAGLLRFESANQYLEAALRIAPDRGREIALVRMRHAGEWLEFADSFGDPEGGGDNFPHLLPVWFTRLNGLLADHLEAPEPLLRLWGKHQEKMEEWLAAGKPAEVEPLLDAWMILAGRIPEVHFVRACWLAASGELDRAAGAMEMALSLRPGEPDWLTDLARLLLAAGRYDEGIGRLTEAVSLDPGAASLWEDLGDRLMSAGDYRNALIAYERCFVALPDRVEALRKMGDCYLAGSEPQAAVAAYEAVLRKMPENVVARERIAQVRALAGS